VKEAIRTVRCEGHDFRVLVPFNKKEKPKVVGKALERGATRTIAGGGDGTINAVADTIIRGGKEFADVSLGVCPLGTANVFARGLQLPVDDLAEYNASSRFCCCGVPGARRSAGGPRLRTWARMRSINAGSVTCESVKRSWWNFW
jgi:hypothetical protein